MNVYPDSKKIRELVDLCETIAEARVLYRSPKYKEEVEILKKDPIILAMVKEIKDHPEHVSYWKEKFDSGMMNTVNKQYHSRGGKKATSIGGPLEAIKELLKENIDEAKSDVPDWMMKKVRNPKTGNTVQVRSLPPEEQEKHKPHSSKKGVDHLDSLSGHEDIEKIHKSGSSAKIHWKGYKDGSEVMDTMKKAGFDIHDPKAGTDFWAKKDGESFKVSHDGDEGVTHITPSEHKKKKLTQKDKDEMELELHKTSLRV